ncbi:MAG: hypothetical protein JWQ38_2653 [Flavipsychrobacter sp.]|nr:hypothetical protein [Flavipsychrobacter sp.]
MKRNNIDIILAVFLVIMAATARVVNAQMHLFNFVPIAAVGLFSGAVIKDRRALAFLIPVMGQLLGDLYFQLFTEVRGFYDLTGMLFNYGGLVAATALGASMKQPKPVATLAYLLGASGLFFLVSNFGYFAHGWNGYSFSGLVKTYADAVPFFKNTLAGDMIGGVVLFGGYFMLQQALTNKAQKANA